MSYTNLYIRKQEYNGTVTYTVYEPTNDPVLIDENTVDISFDQHKEFITIDGKRMGNMITRRGGDRNALISLCQSLIVDRYPEVKDKLKFSIFSHYVKL